MEGKTAGKSEGLEEMRNHLGGYYKGCGHPKAAVINTHKAHDLQSSPE